MAEAAALYRGIGADHAAVLIARGLTQGTAITIPLSSALPAKRERLGCSQRIDRFVWNGPDGLTITPGEGPDLFPERRKPSSRMVLPSAELATITGKDPLPRTEMVKRVWNHIKANHLQDPLNKREIVADDKLRAVFGKDRVSMFEMNKHLARHVSGSKRPDRELPRRRAEG